MILSKDKLYFIDFGLSFNSKRTEDKATDLHLIKQALEAKHFKNFKAFFSQILKGYKKSNQASEVLKRLEKVESRGRYKKQY
jgi:Kae1-associated kinase Bud32